MKHSQLVQMIRCAIFAAILCVCAPITVPLGPIPFSMLMFAVLLCGVALDWRSGLLSVLVFLLLSLFLPVFSGGNTGVTALFGPTGGYIWSCLAVVPLVSFLAQPGGGFPRQVGAAMTGCVAGLAVCYLCGTLQFSLLAGTGFLAALKVCVIPFLLPDLLKAALASLLGVTVRKYLKTLAV